MVRTTSAVVASVVAAMGGCALGPQYERPKVALPSTWTQPAQQPEQASEQASEQPSEQTRESSDVTAQPGAEAGALDGWWRAFNDATLERLIELAVRQSLPLQVSGLRIAESRAQLALAGAGGIPTLRLKAEATAVGLPKALPYVADLPSDQRNFLSLQAGFDAAWEADLWGKYRRGVEAGEASLAASQHDYDFALLSMTAEVARTYTVMRTYEVLIAQAEENTRLQEEGMQLADSRFRNGATSELDVVQASALLASTRASVPHLQISLQQAKNALATLLGEPVQKLDLLLTGPKQMPTITALPIGVPAEILRRRPDVKSAEERASAQAALLGVAETELFPLLFISGEVGVQATTAADVDVNPLNNLYYNVGPRLLWPVFDAGETRNRVRIEDARYEQLLVDYQNVVLVAAREVEDALASVRNAQDAVKLEESAVTSARRAVEIALVQYREGASDYQRVLDAQRTLLEAESTLSQTRSALATGHIALYKALGGGWQSRRGQSITTDEARQTMEQRTNWGGLLTAPAAAEGGQAGQP